ncbi:predicted protein [Verticillium alfalfae VaMs.102]|uniref:Uncharacterized protein n=2 Tax=Verticillium TaxID=1036719 RepID=G2X4W8_VERDV|nr:predicted protein [Verticillium alfalfae VaMs.102]XP_009653231.1 uncharacterized protein VDAG_05200 [Verticillium dahliae VdLs.17]EEY23994.1 predicted protein [Verticillium alfalfae VaMs.102]EGY23762.1 hypothetical protein VDAG_05200 [Verticillium dahliae VdLs.17]
MSDLAQGAAMLQRNPKSHIAFIGIVAVQGEPNQERYNGHIYTTMRLRLR